MEVLFALVAIAEAAQLAAFFFALRDRESERQAAAKERESLLNRVMTRDYAEYRAFERTAEPKPVSPTAKKEREEQDRLATEAHGLA